MVQAVVDAQAGQAATAIPRYYNFALDLIAKTGEARLRKAAYIDNRGPMTYRELFARAEQFALFLGEHTRPEERVLMCMLDTVDWPVAFLGTLAAGRVAVPVNTLLTEDDYRFIYEDSRPRVLVISDELYPKIENVVGEARDLKILVSGSDTRGHTSFDAAIRERRDRIFTAFPTTRDSIAFWLYTSGSTGKPKAAVHTHASLRLTNDLYARAVLGLGEDDVVYSVPKLFFAYGLGNAMTFPLSAGATTVLMPGRPTPDSVVAVLKDHGVTAFSACRHSTRHSLPARPRRRDTN